MESVWTLVFTECIFTELGVSFAKNKINVKVLHVYAFRARIYISWDYFPLSYLHGSALKTWTSSWRRDGATGMDTWNAPTMQAKQPLTYRLLESMGLGGPRWLGSSWHRGIAESGSSQLSIETPGDLVWDLPCMQQASYLEGGPLLWILPLSLHVNQKSDDDDFQW